MRNYKVMSKKITPNTPVFSYNMVKQMLEDLKTEDGAPDPKENGRLIRRVDMKIEQLTKVFDMVTKVTNEE